MPLTVPELKTLLQPQISPNSDSEFLRLLQEVEIRLLETGRFLWTRARVTLTPASGIITLDDAYASILGAQVDGHPTDINAMDFEFTPDGPGEIEVTGGIGMRLIDQGLDASDVRTYKVVGCDTVTPSDIVAIVHKAPKLLYDPDISDSDIPTDATINVTCPDVGAIKLALIAISLEEQYDAAGSAKYMSLSYRRLEDRDKARRGNAVQVPALRPSGRGMRPIRTFR